MKKKSDSAINVLLSEFRALRSEIENRGRAQQALVALNITGLAAILGIAISSPEWWKPYFLLVVPFFSSSLGLYYLNHDFSIADIGHYIIKIIRPELRKLTGNKELMKWELWTRELSRWDKVPRELAFGIAVTALFITPSILALAITPFLVEWWLQGVRWLQILWIGGLILTLLASLLWGYRYFYWKGKSKIA